MELMMKAHMPNADDARANIARGAAANIASTAGWLADNADAYVESPTQQNYDDFVRDMRITMHRIRSAMEALGEEA
jgi:hypothetical protein